MATRSHPTPLQTESAELAHNDTTQSADSGANATRLKITVRVLQAMRPGDVVRDTLAGFYAERGRRGDVVFKVAATGGRARGKTVRRTLGKWPALELNDARIRAGIVLAEVRAGRVPAVTAAAAPAPTPTEDTVGAAIDRYLADMRTRQCAPKSITFTGARLRSHLAAWLALPLAEIKPRQCQAEHVRITQASGPVAANKVLRDFRAVWNLAAKQSDTPDRFAHSCPVTSVTMNPEASVREDAVVTDLPGWWQRTGELGNPLRAIMFRLGLLSGLRPSNLAGMRREWIRDLDGDAPAVHFPAAAMKGRGAKRRAFALPLSPAMVDLVRAALEVGDMLMGAAGNGGWVFPTSSRDGRSVVATSNWTEPTLGAHECGHALRHTFRTLATGAGVPYDVAELLVAHVMPGVGGRYVHAGELDARLRAAQCSVTDHVLRAVGAAGGGALYGLG